MAKHISKGKMSAAYWADKVKWQASIVLNLPCGYV